MKGAGIIICQCRGEISRRIDLEELIRSLSPSFPVGQSNALCEAPQELDQFSGQVSPVVVGACSGEEYLQLFRKQLRQCGRNPFSVKLVNIKEQCALIHPPKEAGAKARLLLWAQAQCPENEIGSENLKAVFVTRQEGVSRRELFHFFTPRYQVVPNIRGDICTSQWGCRLCLSSCPTQALLVEAGRVHLDKNRCESCGACLPACPWDAIHFPPLAPEALEQQLRGLLSREFTDLSPRLLLIHCPGSERVLNEVGSVGGSYPASVIPLGLPCLVMLSPFLILRAFDLGAEGVAVLPCPKRCLYGFDLKRLHRGLGFLYTLMPHLGLSPERLQLWDEEPLRLALHLERMVRVVEKLGRLDLREKAYPSLSPFSPLVLAHLVKKTKTTEFTLEGNDVPFGLVNIRAELCSTCRLCATICMSRALTFEKREGRLELLFHHSRCVACGECVRVCPDGALSIKRALDSRLLLEPQCLIGATVVHCSVCGKEVAPGPLLGKIQQKLELTSPGKQDALYLCSHCRLQRLAKLGLAGDTEKVPTAK